MQLQDRIGAFIVPGGCFFRVWAPNAENVAVLVQEPPYWEVDDVITRQDLVKGAKGYWSGSVPGVRAYQIYRFEIRFAGNTFERLDSAGRDVFSSELARFGDPSNRNASIIPGPDAFPWAPFQTPRFEDFIIYQFHIGTFSGRNDDLGKDWASFEDTINKLGYIRDMGFNCIQPLPVHEYSRDRSWGYNPATFFAPESSFGSQFNL